MLVLETNAEKRESSSLSRPTKNISQNIQNSKNAKWNCRKNRNAKLTVAAYRTVLKTDCSGNWVGIDTSAWRQKKCHHGVMVSQRFAKPSIGLNRCLRSNRGGGAIKKIKIAEAGIWDTSTKLLILTRAHFNILS